ncbi:MAG: sulfite exporter TauE/SafE family protein [Bacteroidota bacterium]
MSLELLPLLVAAGALGGFIAGLVGVGGGIIFTPVLLFTFRGLGIEDPVLTPLTLGSGLLCTFAASASGAAAQARKDAIEWRTALTAGAFAALAVILMTTFVTTQPWYSRRVFQLVLSAMLLFVVVRMLTKKDRQGDSLSAEGARRGWPALIATGAGAGTIAAAAGIGGGVVLVPAFSGLVRLPLKLAAGTSTAAIVLITLVGVGSYLVRGLGAPVPEGALGYVHVPYALALALPAVVMARLGVSAAHRVHVKWVRWAFAAFAGTVAIRLLWNALG